MKSGRNDPCHCGSGLKYKRCHYASDNAASAVESAGTMSPAHELDERMVYDILAYLEIRFPGDFLDEADALSTYPKMSPQLMMPWLAYVADFEGRTGVDWFLEERGWSLSRGAREWLEAQQKGWLSIWEVIEFERGRSVTVRDTLTAEERVVHEVSGSKNTERHLLTLGRVVDFGAVSLFCGMHLIPLRPAAGAAVVERVRKSLRRRTAVSPDRLRNAKIAWRMLQAWSDAIERALQPPVLQNTDGDPFLLVEERWNFQRHDREEVIRRLATIEGADREDGSEEGEAFTFTRPGNPLHQTWDNTIVGRASVSEDTLFAETNSTARADVLREKIDNACGDLLVSRGRSLTDPAARVKDQAQRPSALPDAGNTPDADEDAETPEEHELILQMKERHYAEWIHDSIPALGGKTPREAAKTKRGREQLDALLKDLEFTEHNQPEAVRFDVRKLRLALGLPV